MADPCVEISWDAVGRHDSHREHRRHNQRPRFMLDIHDGHVERDHDASHLASIPFEPPPVERRYR